MANPFTVQPLGGIQGINQINQGMQNISNTSQANQAEEQRRAVMSQAQDVLSRGDPQEIAQFSLQNPDIGRQIQGSVQFKNDATRQNMMQGMQQIIAGGNPEQILNQRAQFVESQGGDATQTRQEIEVLRADPEGYIRQVENSYALMDPEGFTAFREARGGPGGPDFGKVQPGDFTPASLQTYGQSGDFNDLVRYESSKSVNIGGVPHVFDPSRGQFVPASLPNSGAGNQPSTPITAQTVGESEAEIEGAKEGAKLNAQLAFKPAIAEAVKTAEASAKSRGESLSELGRAKASLPGLKEVVNKLITLSDVATYTLAGKGFDEVTKQLGFGATKGATARAKMESLVSNQILPLLRDTFGAQFTEREGESLRKTMLDIDAAPEQKKAILNSFFEQKIRDIETKQSTLNEQSPSGQSAGMSSEDADAVINELLGQ